MRRQHVIFAITLAVLFGSIVTAAATARQRDEQLRGYVDAAQSSDLPYWMPHLGVNAELTQYDESELDQQLALMQAANVTWVRQFFRWDEIEPTRGQYDWSITDQIVNAFADRSELRLVAVLANSPDWAHPSTAAATPSAPPDDPAAFATFARAFTERYGETVDHYQIWDEPNLTAAWGDLQPRPADYAALLSAAYSAIHGADPQAMVIAAALAPTAERGPENVGDVLYLRDLYALGAKEYTDAFAAKPYGFAVSPQDRTVSEEVLNFSRIVLLREEMVRNGDAAAPLWASSWGWNSLPDEWSGEPSIWGAVTGGEQIQYTLAALDRAEREWPWLGGMILYQWQADAPPDSPQWGFALIDQQSQPTPLYEALAARTPQTRAANGLHFATNLFTRYSGVWTFGELGADIGWVQDSQLEFDFSGRDVSLLLRQDNYAAFLYATIDGQPANAAPRDAAGNAIINLKSGSLEPELGLVPVARSLADGEHTLHLVADRGWDRWAIAGFAVGSGNLAAPYDSQIAAALLTAVVAALAASAAAVQIDWRPITRPFALVWMRLGDAGQLVASAITSVALLIGMLLTWGDALPALFRREPVPFGLAIVTAGLLYVEPGALMALFAGAILFLIFYHRVEYGLTLTLFYAPFFLFPVELWRFSFPMAELLILITSGAWVLRQLGDWGRRRQSANDAYPPPTLYERLRRFHALDWGVVAWLALGIFSLAWAAYRDQAITELRTLIVEPALFYVLLRSTAFSRRTLLRLIDALLLAGMIVCLVGLFQYVRGEAIITAEDGARRLASVYGSPNNVGLLLGRCIPFALAFTLLPLDRRRRGAAALALVLMLITLILTQSAGAIFLGVPVGIAAVLLLVFGRRGLYALLGLGAVGAAAFLVLANASARFSRVFDLSEGTSFFRLRLWESTLQMLRDHPITGLGLDQFLYFYRGIYILPDAWQEPNLSHPHNILLDWWIRLGFFGLLLLIGLQIVFWSSALRLYRRFRSANHAVAAVIVGMMGSMAALIAHGLIDNSVYVQDLTYLFVLLLGITASLSGGTTLEAAGGSTQQAMSTAKVEA
jgi:O-antigen ligase